MTGATVPPHAGTRPPRLADDSPGFLARIGQGWADREAPAPVAAAARAAAEHRARLGAELPQRTIVLAAGRAPRRNGDADYAFRADSDFVWATSCQVEGGVLVMTPRPGGHDAVLYLPPPAGPGERDFYVGHLDQHDLTGEPRGCRRGRSAGSGSTGWRFRCRTTVS